MRYMATYDLMETARVTNQWLGATAQAMGSFPATGLVPNPAFQMIRAWGEVTERTFARMVAKPDWGIETVVAGDGRDHVVEIVTELAKPFGDLIRFQVQGRAPKRRRVLLVAPMSGHYATLLRSTVVSLLPDAEVWITDWHNARDIPVSEGKFDVDDYTLYLAEFMQHLGPDIHVIAVCQPAPLALAATAYLAERQPDAQPTTLTLIGGPIDPDAAPTEVTDFGNRVTMGQLHELVIQRVGFKYAGAGRMVYPGLLQLASFISMNADKHARAFGDQILRVAKDQAGDHDKHNRFYDEYLAVMDMTKEFYMSTVERVFKSRDIARNVFTVNGESVDIGKITTVAVKIVEGEDDDISAPGQCLAALDLLTGLPDEKKASHLEPGAGHYGIFAGRSWRNNIRPLVLDFIDMNSDAPLDPQVHAAAEAVPEAPRPVKRPSRRRTGATPV
ncbi:polyhydroxyalkanoate depolymerase [Rhodobacteraceae bacterium CCMM004]|nr:polyhydroxyalkanoate depolymerase [Rhodobacteraceae bacterium CCMM004]